MLMRTTGAFGKVSLARGLREPWPQPAATAVMRSVERTAESGRFTDEEYSSPLEKKEPGSDPRLRERPK
jgi:hypothetical protein